MAEDRLLTPREVAERLGRHEKTVIRWCREGSLPCKRFGKLWGVMASGEVDGGPSTVPQQNKGAKPGIMLIVVAMSPGKDDIDYFNR